MVVEVDEELFVVHDFALPGRGIDVLELVERLAQFSFVGVEPGPAYVFEVGSPADGRFLRLRTAVDPVNDPHEYAHVLGIAGPEEAAVLVLTEPVDVEDARRDGERSLPLEPMA